jgi:hypothetical protein
MSYITIEAAKVKVWCDNTLKSIEKSRKEQVEERIQHYMKPTKFLGFTLDKGMTYDEAKKWVYNDPSEKTIGDGIEDYMCVNAHREKWNKVWVIKRLAEAAIKNNKGRGIDAYINLSSKDYGYLYIGRD